MRHFSNRWLNLLILLCIFAGSSYLYLLGQHVRQLEGMVFDLELARARQEAAPVSPLLLDFELNLLRRGELFPAMVSSAEEEVPVALLYVSNAAPKPVASIIEAEIPGWSRPLQLTEIVGPGETRRVEIQPALLARAFANEEIQKVPLEIRVTDVEGSTLFAERRSILLHGGSDLLWGSRFANAQAAARWVTPHDPAVLELVSRARDFAPRGRLAGYGPSRTPREAVARHVENQAQAVFRAMKASGISYVNSLFVMGEFLDRAQRVRLPRETLSLKSANCMDMSVAFASAMENLGLQPVIALVPGHAVVGVRLNRGSEEITYLDLTVLPDGSFQSASDRARRLLDKTPAEKVLVVDVVAARSLGFYPLVASDAAPS